MKKKQYNQLYITLIFILIVSITLYYMYPLFSFHTYKRRVYSDVVASVENEIVALHQYGIFVDENTASYGNGTLHIKDFQQLIENVPNTVEGSILEVAIIMEFQTDTGNNKTIQKDYDITALENGIYELSIFAEEENNISFPVLKKATMEIKNAEHKIAYPLRLLSAKPIKSAIKEYRMEAASVAEQILRVGKLVTSYDLVKQYDTIAMEYRYMKDPEGNIEDIDNYVVFKKITEPTKEYVKTKEFGTFHYDGEELLEDKALSVVIILSKGEKEYVFSMDLEKETVGGTYD